MIDFRGRHVWIIGASSGIGRALTMQLVREGAVLTVSSRSASALQDVSRAAGGTPAVLPLDVTDDAAMQAAATHIGRIDTMIYLAGQYTPGMVMDASVETIRQTIDTNLMGAFGAVRAVLPVMHAQGHGQIALCGSIAGYRGLPRGQPYSATKAALISLAESLHVEEAARNIDVRLISPGFVDTPMTLKNNFHMPMMISAEQAADAIAHGLKGRAFEIHFPRRMTWPMKILRFLPDALYFKIAGKM